jgi:hypothetical protein
MGVLSALPFINVGNCCCLWVISGGVVAAYLLQQNQTAPITPGDGALVGLLAGLAGALVWLVVSIPLDLLMAPVQRAMFERAMEMSGSMPPEMAEMFERFGSPGAMGMMGFIGGKVIGLLLMLFGGAIFSTLGGLLGAAVFRKPGLPGGPANAPGGPGFIDVPPAS